MSTKIVRIENVRFKLYSFRDKKDAKRFASKLGHHCWETCSIDRTHHNVIVKL